MKEKIVCQNCGAVYDHAPDFCECGAEIMIEELEPSEKDQEEIKNETIETDDLKEEITDEEIKKETSKSEKEEIDLTKDMFDEEIEIVDPPKIQIFKEKTLYLEYPFNYDEITVGRSNYKVDIDLRELDEKKEISRNQLVITKENEKYYIKNISKKNKLVIDGKVLNIKEKKELKENSKIIINKKIGIKIITA